MQRHCYEVIPDFMFFFLQLSQNKNSGTVSKIIIAEQCKNWNTVFVKKFLKKQANSVLFKAGIISSINLPLQKLTLNQFLKELVHFSY